MLDKFQVLNEQIQALKIEFEAFIKNQDIPLADRWYIFFAAPSYLKNHSSWMNAVPKCIPEEMTEYNTSPLYWEKHQTYTAEDFVERFESALGEKTRGGNPFHRYSSRANTLKEEDINSQLTQELINQIKEEFLANNTGSFVWDW